MLLIKDIVQLVTFVNQLLERVERHCRHFLSHGTTTIEAKSGYGLSVEDGMKSLKKLILS
jgi:hypothetical protein